MISWSGFHASQVLAYLKPVSLEYNNSFSVTVNEKIKLKKEVHYVYSRIYIFRQSISENMSEKISSRSAYKKQEALEMPCKTLLLGTLNLLQKLTTDSATEFTRSDQRKKNINFETPLKSPLLKPLIILSQ